MTESEKQYQKTIKLTKEVSRLTGMDKDAILVSYGATLFASELLKVIEERKEELSHLEDTDFEILWSRFHKILMDFIKTRIYINGDIVETFADFK